MLPHKSDSAVLTHASTSYVEECLLAGMKIYFYNAGMLHGKVLLVDDDFVTLGSTNFDYRSFEHNFEENIVMYSPEVNAEIARLFKKTRRTVLSSNSASGTAANVLSKPANHSVASSARYSEQN